MPQPVPHWPPLYTTQASCIAAGLRQLGRGVSLPWLFGASAHAFCLNIADGCHVSGPTAWDYRPVQRLVANLGARIEGLRVFHKDAEGKFDQFQRQAWTWCAIAWIMAIPAMAFT